MSDTAPESQAPYPQPLVSIVMPVHDQERVLRQTLDSIHAQTLRNFELVLVDDGSVDGSRAIEREFAGRDPRIRLFPRKAEGAGPARNFGLSEAAGRYVVFLDSDDLFHPDLLLDMAAVLEATGADICICEADTFSGEDRASFGDRGRTRPFIRIERYDDGLYGRRAFGRDTFQVGGWGTLWNKMFRREFLMDVGVLFPNVKRNEDSFFMAKAMWEAGSVYLLKRPLVLYRRGLGTSIQDESHKYLQDALRVAEMIFHGIDDQGAFSESEAAGLRFRCMSLLTMAADDYLAMGTYSEPVHESLAAGLRRWGPQDVPRSQLELNIALQATLITHASRDKVIWACDRWKQKNHGHTLPEKLGYATRVFIAVALSRPKAARGFRSAPFA